jgi:hypothetical protein
MATEQREEGALRSLRQLEHDVSQLRTIRETDEAFRRWHATTTVKQADSLDPQMAALLRGTFEEGYWAAIDAIKGRIQAEQTKQLRSK